MTAPPSKSMAHRMIVCAGLAQGTSVIRNVDPSQDILATIDCMKALGAQISYEDRCVTAQGTDLRQSGGKETLPCRECGSTLRFLIPAALMSGNKYSFSGSGKLFERPLTVYEKICAEQGLYYEPGENGLEVAGRLSAGEYEIPGNISSQFISGLLFVLPLLEKDSVIKLIPPVESRPYIGMTMQALEMFGIRTFWEDECRIRVPGGQEYRPCDGSVEGDFSNAAFFEALNLTGGEVTVEGLNEDSLQGDKIYRQHLKRIEEGYARIDLADCPDLGPVLIAAAAMRHGAEFTGTRRLRIKESDRGLAMKQELKKMDIEVETSDNEIRVGAGPRKPLEILNGHNDHRIVMALAVMLTQTGGSISGAEAVRKSLPDFWTRLKELGVQVTYDELDQ